MVNSCYDARDSKIFLLDTATGKIVTKQMMPPRKVMSAGCRRAGVSLLLRPLTNNVYCLQRATASAFASAQGTSYTFAIGTDCGEIHIYTADPFSGLVAGNKVRQ